MLETKEYGLGGWNMEVQCFRLNFNLEWRSLPSSLRLALDVQPLCRGGKAGLRNTLGAVRVKSTFKSFDATLLHGRIKRTVSELH